LTIAPLAAQCPAMTGGTTSRHEIAAALGWLVDAGIDTVVGDAPFAWLADAGPVAPPPAAVALVNARTEIVAINADSLTALAAAMAEAYPAALFADGAGDIMIIGERPSLADAASGRVFSDAAGSLLDRMLGSIGRGRDAAILVNIVAMPSDRAATPAEIAAFAPFVRRHIQLARPRAILALGQAAASALTGASAGINRLRGKWHEVDGVAVMPTFAPAHLLLHPGHKALAWADLCAFRARLDG
jgi:uracil-DNA glycosylase family 4